jgi:ATP-binding cassette subfamily B protein
MNTRNPILYLLSTGWRYASGCRRLIVTYLIMFVAAQSVALFEPYVIGKMLNAVQTDLSAATGKVSFDRLLNDVAFYLFLYMVIQVAFWLFHGPGRVLERFVAFQIRSNYKSELYQCLTKLPMQWQRNHHSGESIDKINRGAIAVFNFFQETFEIVYMLFRLGGTLVILFFFVQFAAWCVLASTVVLCLIVAIFDRKLSRQYGQLNSMDNHAASAIHDYVTNIVSVITLRLEHRTLKEVEKRITASQSLFSDNARMNEWKWFLSNMCASGMVVVILLWYAKTNFAPGHALLAGTFFTLFEYLRRIGDSFFNFTGYYGVIVRQAADLKSAESIVDAFEEQVGREHSHRLPAQWQKLNITGLNFTYEDERHRTHHLQDINILLEKGLSIAFVGASGSGKSTLLSLLRGLQNADSANVVCDGVPLDQKLAHLWHTTTLMPQEPEIFADTIRFNINFGLDSDDEELLDAVAAARFDNVLARLPQGLDTNIAENGVNLSGGEKQRLALARGIYFSKDSDIVLLDEPTSSVDTPNERKIYATLLERYKSSCLVSSIHKLHLLELFDRIYVFDDGKIVESGDFKSLLQADGMLASMWREYQTEQSEVVLLA